MRGLGDAVEELSLNAASINSTLLKIVTNSTIIAKYNTQSNNTKYSISIIPNGTLGGLASIEYPTPLNESVSYYSNDSSYASYNLTPVFSTFPSILGNDSDSESLIGELYYQLYYAGK